MTHVRAIAAAATACLTVVTACAALGESGAAYALPAPQYWASRVFSLPFQVASPAAGEPGPVEVQLHVSLDRGATWRLAARLAPAPQGAFVFEAEHDGEYCFMVRTLDAARRVFPAGPAVPELRVVVDTAKPVLNLYATQGEAGELFGVWRAADDHLDSDSLKVEYRPAADAAAWQVVAVERLTRTQGDPFYSGNAKWWPEVRHSAYDVRLTLSDVAGNVAVSEFRVASHAAGSTAAIDTWRPRTTETPADPSIMTSLASGMAAIGSSSGPALGGVPPAPPPMDQGFPATSGDSPPLDDPNAAYGRALWTPPAGISQPSIEPLSGGGTAPEPIATPSGPEEIPPGIPAGRSGVAKPVADPFAPTDASLDEARTFAGQILPPGEQPRMVNARRFQLEYEVQSIGASGISKVELWGSRDGGRSWASYGADDDNLSPLVVSVDQEGLYGFRIVVETTSGLSGRPPLAGDPPDIWVGVDLSKPTARFVSAEQGAAEQAGELLIRWEAADQQLAARPISLYFSDAPGGPWTPIASGLENRGSYAWRLEPRTPDFVYLRLEVRDEAGNVQEIRTQNAVAIERVRPEGHIRGVRPVLGTASGPTRITNLHLR